MFQVSEGESENESENDETSEVSAEMRTEEAVSVHSESEMDVQDDLSHDTPDKIESSDVFLEENNRSDDQNGKDSTSPEVHEILSDVDDGVIEGKQEAKPPVVETPVQLRRSSRAIKRKRYDDEIENGDAISDLEDNYVNKHIDSHKRRSKAIVINDTKTLVEMAAKQMKSGIQKKEPTVVIIDTKSMVSSKGNAMKKSNISNSNINNALSAQSLYQSIVARGTTVTPVSSKNLNSHNFPNSHSNNNSAQQSILPSLTDDMYVVEAPSFIVPYVYEKPSIKPFREFVDNLGNELKEQQAKEDELKEKEGKKEESTEDDEKEEKDDSEVDETQEEKEVVKSKEEQLEESKQKKRDEKKGIYICKDFMLYLDNCCCTLGSIPIQGMIIFKIFLFILITRFPLRTLLYVGYSVKRVSKVIIKY